MYHSLYSLTSVFIVSSFLLKVCFLPRLFFLRFIIISSHQWIAGASDSEVRVGWRNARLCACKRLDSTSELILHALKNKVLAATFDLVQDLLLMCRLLVKFLWLVQDIKQWNSLALLSKVRL